MVMNNDGHGNIFCFNSLEYGVESRASDAMKEFEKKGAGSGQLKSYDYFHWHDVLSLPFLEGSDAREHSEVEIYRISPVDSRLKPSYVRDGRGKLAGTAAAAFGGFLQREWREHDMMWGRLDGAERIIIALLPDFADDNLRKRVHR